MSTLAAIEQHPFCQFINRVTNSLAAKRAFTSLEQHHGLNPTILLFCLWYAQCHSKRLNLKEVKQLISLPTAWHERIVQSLRERQQRLRQSQASRLKNELEPLISQILKEAELYEQIMLANGIQAPDNQSRSLQQVIIDVCHNLAAYCKLLQIRLDVEDCEAISLIIICAFPEFSYEKANALCKKHLYKASKPAEVGQTQLRLRLQ